mgnify:FL=1|jgi:hypothetical protein
MRLALIGLLALFQSCQPKEDLPTPQAEPGEQTTQVFGDKLDKADHRVAASVQVAREANKEGQPAKVEAELSIAAAYLPNAPEGDVAFARQRAQAADPKAIAEAVAYGQKLKGELDGLWTKMEAQQKQAQLEISALKQHCDDKQLELDAAAKEKRVLILAGLGAGMLALGVGLLAFGHFIGVSKWSAALVILGGALTSALPWVIESTYFPWVIGVTLGLASLQALLVLGVKTWVMVKALLTPGAKVETITTQPTEPPTPTEQ